MDKERIDYLDVIKFLAIVMVIFCHNPALKLNSVIDNIFMLSCWAAVPMFFMVTGSIYLNRKFDFNKWKKKICKTYVVLVAWKLIYFLFFYFYNNLNINEISKGLIIKYLFFFGQMDWIQSGHMWFIYAYLQVMLIYPLILKSFESDDIQYKRFFDFILIIILVFAFVINDINVIFKFFCEKFEKNIFDFDTLLVIFPFNKYANMLFFFIMGGYLPKIENFIKGNNIKKFAILILIMILSLISMLLIRFCYTKTFTWDGCYLKDGYSYIATVMISISLFEIIKLLRIKLNNIFSFAAQNTLGIFYIHFIILNLVGKYISSEGVLFNLVKTFIVLGVSMSICYLMKKIKVIKEIF